MNAMLESMKALVLESEAKYESMNAEVKRCLKEDTDESLKRAWEVELESHKEYQRLSDYRHSLYYLRRALGHDVDIFHPEKF